MQIKNNLRDAIEVLLWLEEISIDFDDYATSVQVKRILDHAICHIVKEIL
jgi:hypothetical protein